jgi:F-type H+-transporting ATPase subunit gamma
VNRDLLQVVRTTKLLAAVAIARLEQSVLSAERIFSNVSLACGAAWVPSPFQGTSAAFVLPQVQFQEPVVLILGASQGMAGNFDSSLAAFVESEAHALSPANRVFVSGKKLATSVRAVGLRCEHVFDAPDTSDGATLFVDEFLKVANVVFDERVNRGVIVLFNERGRGNTGFVSTSRSLFAAGFSDEVQKSFHAWPNRLLPDVIGDTKNRNNVLVFEFLRSALFLCCCRSLMAENFERFGAMQRAEKRIEDMLEQTTLEFHRERQELIDAELFDVVMGAFTK